MKPLVTYIIPHRGNFAVLNRHLRLLNGQTFRDFEVIVSIDDYTGTEQVETEGLHYPITVHCVEDRLGPATARNQGAEMAKGDLLLFVGSDTMPTNSLISMHYWNHKNHDVEIVQGYTPWHPLAITPFTDFIDRSGLQSNWEALKEEDGSWKEFISPLFCLTTNYSISKGLFSFVGGFDERFTGAAWEDIELGYRLNKFGVRGKFAKDAINYHLHRYDLESFARRSYMEGLHRMTLCTIHTELSHSMLEPHNLRAIAGVDLDRELNYAKMLVNLSSNEVEEGYRSLMKSFSIAGVRKTLMEHEVEAYKAVIFGENPHHTVTMFAGATSLSKGFVAYALHCAGWLVSENPDTWYVHYFSGEVNLRAGNIDAAKRAFNRANLLNPSSSLVEKRLRELNETATM